MTGKNWKNRKLAEDLDESRRDGRSLFGPGLREHFQVFQLFRLIQFFRFLPLSSDSSQCVIKYTMILIPSGYARASENTLK